MYINKLIKKQVMLILATVVLVGTLAVTTSFAVFEETKSNATDQKMTIGNLDVILEAQLLVLLILIQ